MDERILELILTIIPVIGAVVTYFVVPCLKAAAGSAKLQQYREWAGLAVKCAEMVWAESGHGGDKKEFAARFLERMFNSKKVILTEAQIHVLIEAAVQELQGNADAGKLVDDGK